MPLSRKSVRGKITAGGLLIALILGSLAYLSFKIIPIIWNYNELEKIVKEHSFKVRARNVRQAEESLINTVHEELDILLDPEEVEVELFRDRAQARAVWRPVLEFPFGHTYELVFDVVKETRHY